MGLFDWLSGGKKKNSEDEEELEGLSGLKVDVLDSEGDFIFAAYLSVSYDNEVFLKPVVRFAPAGAKRLSVQLRAYKNAEKKAVHINAEIETDNGESWQVHDPVLVSKDNDRAAFRQSISADGEVMPYPSAVRSVYCKVLNVSVGGVCIQCADEFSTGEKLMLRVRLLEGKELSPMICEVRRVTRRKTGFEYGCEFENLDPATEELISKTVVALQLKHRA